MRKPTYEKLHDLRVWLDESVDKLAEAIYENSDAPDCFDGDKAFRRGGAGVELWVDANLFRDITKCSAKKKEQGEVGRD